ncbi:hypothetical protein BpHYR1_042335 [Brachionus plicatilis]|uniref:Transmembrane protein n=1 Tax=Brachionus plicatilis TaxID=10195 RepID=A0A3M7SV56_BRAPC|nr:hypothetical protein BpHYR1_042335 [Brachionus plicatilis]
MNVVLFGFAHSSQQHLSAVVFVVVVVVIVTLVKTRVKLRLKKKIKKKTIFVNIFLTFEQSQTDLIFLLVMVMNCFSSEKSFLNLIFLGQSLDFIYFRLIICLIS